MDIKEESCFLNFCAENERDTKDLVKKAKIETVTSSCYIKPEVEDSSCLESEEHHVLRFNETIKESEIETKTDIKEEDWWLKKEDPCINDGIKDESHEDFYFTKPPSLCKVGVSSYTSDLFSTKDLENDVSFNMGKDSLECEGQESIVIDTSSIAASGCSEKSNDGKVVSMASSSKQSKSLQSSNTNKQDFRKENCKSNLSHECRKSKKYDVSIECFTYACHFKNCRLMDVSKGANKSNVLNKGVNQFLPQKAHKLLDEGKKNQKCKICNKSLTQLYLKRHKLIHKGLKQYKCNICSKAFTRSSSLKDHKLIHEGIKPHKCNICNTAFTQLSSLKQHKLIHDGIKPHKCNICNTAFTQLSGLKQHKLIHDGIKPHKCDICNAVFTQSSNLKKHKFIHQGIKPHKCNICNKAFTCSPNLKQHKLIHEGTKPHKCNICNKAFTQLSNLKEHKFIHEGIKPHKCNICNKAFSQLSYIKRHKLVHQDK